MRFICFYITRVIILLRKGGIHCPKPWFISFSYQHFCSNYAILFIIHSTIHIKCRSQHFLKCKLVLKNIDDKQPSKYQKLVIIIPNYKMKNSVYLKLLYTLSFWIYIQIKYVHCFINIKKYLNNQLNLPMLIPVVIISTS